MVSLAQLVNDSLARHGVRTNLDPLKLRWSKWIPCEDTLSLINIPGKPGIYALAEEMVAPGEISATGAKRVLALFEISEANDLGMALGRLFLPGSREYRRLEAKPCFARYTVIEDDNQRRAACTVFRQWLNSSADAALGISTLPQRGPGSSNEEDQIGPPLPLPAGF